MPDENALNQAPTHYVDGSAWVQRIVLLFLGCIAAAGLADLLLVHLDLSPSRILARSFDVSLEESIGTWISTILALMVALTAFAIAAHTRKHNARLMAAGWTVVALFFLYVSVDDTAKLHERLGTLLRLKLEQRTDTPLGDWFPSYGWQLFLAPLFIMMGLYILWFSLRAVAPPMRIWVLVALTLYGIAVGLDFFEGQFRGPLEAAEADGTLETAMDDSTRHLLQLVEEVLEMLGTTAFLYVFLATLNARIRLALLDVYK